MADVAVTDDWVYYRTVQTLLSEHQLRIHEMSSAALVFQAFWGALFGAALGLSFGALRISTLVMVGLGGVAVYGLARELGASRSWSALAMLTYLFHPLALPLAYSFMTDPHFTSLLVISAWLYVRGVRTPRKSGDLLVLGGSAIASAAVLVRQQGLAIPLAVLAFMVFERRLAPSMGGVRRVLLISGLPAATFAVYTAWLRLVHGVPWALDLFSDELAATGWRGVLDLLPRLGATQAIYIGLFVLPLAVATGPGLSLLRSHLRWRAWLVTGLWTALVVVGSVVLASQGWWMPYVGQFITTTGLGPEDVVAARPQLFDLPLREVLTVACALASIAWGLRLAQYGAPVAARAGSAFRLIVWIMLAQAVATVPASIHFAVWGGTLDRYLLPLLPLSIVLFIGTIARAHRWGSAAMAFAIVVAMSIFSVAGTSDNLAFLDTVWSLAHEANALGVPDTRLDAGAGWDGLHLYMRPPSPEYPPQTPHPPWWVDLWAPATDSSYVVAGAQVAGYVPVRERTYWSWLRREPLTVYLLRRADVDGPP